MEKKEEMFQYTYSAAQQEEIRKIREKYIPREETKLEQDDVLYWVTKSRAVYLQNEPIYVCAILQKVVAS